MVLFIISGISGHFFLVFIYLFILTIIKRDNMEAYKTTLVYGMVILLLVSYFVTSSLFLLNNNYN